MTTTTTDTAPASAMFDLQTIEEAMHDSAWLTIEHPKTKAPTAMRIRLASPDSETFRKVDRRVKNRNFKAARKSKDAMTVEVMEYSGLELLVGATLGWEGISLNGKPVIYNPENVRKLYEDFPFIRDQVDEFVADRANFFSS